MPTTHVCQSCGATYPSSSGRCGCRPPEAKGPRGFVGGGNWPRLDPTKHATITGRDGTLRVQGRVLPLPGAE